MRAAWAETRAEHPDPGLRPRVYEGTYPEVFQACTAALGELDNLEVAEADPRRGAIGAWVKLLPLASLPLLGPPKDPRAGGRGWFHRLDPRLSKGWLQLRIEAQEPAKPQDPPRVRVQAHLRLEVPAPGLVAALLLKGYLRWLDVRRGLPAKP